MKRILLVTAGLIGWAVVSTTVAQKSYGPGARHQDQHQPERFLSDRADAVDEVQWRGVGVVR